LIAYKEALLVASDKHTDEMSNTDAVEETENVDVVILRHELEKYRRRLEFWVRRREELARS